MSSRAVTILALLGVLVWFVVSEASMYSVPVDVVRKALRDAAWNAGVAPDLLDAIGKVESEWNIDAVNADDPGGGAWGPTQILGSTLRRLGFSGSPTDITTYASAAGFWSAKYMASRPGGPPTTAEDAAAWWNAGTLSIAAAPASTRDSYLPRLRAALAYVYENLPSTPEA